MSSQQSGKLPEDEEDDDNIWDIISKVEDKLYDTNVKFNMVMAHQRLNESPSLLAKSEQEVNNEGKTAQA